MRISKALLSLVAIAGLVVAVGCADEAVKDSGVEHKTKSAPATSAPASDAAPAAPAAPTSAPASSAA